MGDNMKYKYLILLIFILNGLGILDSQTIRKVIPLNEYPANPVKKNLHESGILKTAATPSFIKYNLNIIQLSNAPYDLCIPPGSNYAFCTIPEQNKLMIFDFTKGNIIDSIIFNYRPMKMIMSKDGSMIYIASNNISTAGIGAGCVYAINTANYKTVTEMFPNATPQIPWVMVGPFDDVMLDENKSLIYIMDDSYFYVMDLKQNLLVSVYDKPQGGSYYNTLALNNQRIFSLSSMIGFPVYMINLSTKMVLYLQSDSAHQFSTMSYPVSSPDGKSVFITVADSLYNAKGMDVFNSETGALVKFIPNLTTLGGFIYNKDSTLAYVNNGQFNITSTQILNLSTLTQVGQINTGGYSGRTSTDNRFLYFAKYGCYKGEGGQSGIPFLLDLTVADLNINYNFTINTSPIQTKYYDYRAIALSSDNKYVVITNPSLNSISAVSNIQELVPDTVTLTSPENNSKVVPASIAFNWANKPDITSYQMQISVDEAFSNIVYQDSLIKINNCTLDTLKGGKQYFWRVRAKNIIGWSNWSEIRTFTHQLPATPAVVLPIDKAAQNLLTINLSWGSIPNVTNYIVQVATDTSFINLIVNDSTLSSLTKQITGLNDGVRYYWRVAARNVIGTSLFSDIKSFSTIINAPGSLTAQAMPSEKIYLKWTDNSNNNSGYIIERKLSTDNNYTVIDTVKSDIIGYIDTTLNLINTFKYRVKAYNPIEISAYSNEIAVGTIPSYPALPILAGPIDNSSNQAKTLNLCWDSAAYADTYRLQVSKDSAFNSFVLNDSTISTTTKQMTGLDDGVKYYWRVNSKNASGISSFSDTRSFSTILNTPESLAATALWGYKVSLKWTDKSNNESDYVVECKLASDTGFVLVSTLPANTVDYSDSSLTMVGTYNYRVKAVNTISSSLYSNIITVTTITGVDNKYSQIPTKYELSQNYPNPFNPTTVIEYGLPSQSLVKIVVYNILGEIVKVLVNTEQSAGYHSISFEGSNISSGIYFYRIEAKSLDGSKQFRKIKKMLLLK
jgi:hypothetical protein